jgi:nucleoid-associated protein YgaU
MIRIFSAAIFLTSHLALSQGAEMLPKEDSQNALNSATPNNSGNNFSNSTIDNADGSFNNAESESPAIEDPAMFDVQSNPSGGNAMFNDQAQKANASNADINPVKEKPKGISAFGQAAPVTNQAAPLQGESPNNIPANPALTNQVNPASVVNQTMPDVPAEEAAVNAGPEDDLVISAPPLPPPNEFAGAPPVPGTRRIMAEGEAPEEYIVEDGDSLYDISEQLLSDGGYWPKLWALNPDIKNPHFIFPNMRLRFYPGNDDTPPYLQVVGEDDVIPIEKGGLDEEELLAEKVIFEEKGIEEQIVEVIGPESVEPLTDEILMGGNLFSGGEVKVQVPGFIFRSEKEPLAFVIGGRSGEISLGPDSKAVIESKGSLNIGTLYTVLRRGEAINSPKTGDDIGYKYYYVGNLKVTKNLGEDAYLADVKDNRLSVLPDDIVVEFISTRRTVPADMVPPEHQTLDAAVVGFEYAGQEIGGAGHYAFIDRGTGGGVNTGMYVGIYATPGYLSSSFGSAGLPVDFEHIATMKIIDTTDAGAVGYIVQNKLEVKVGDRTEKRL